jgi:hypothetical protein
MDMNTEQKALAINLDAGRFGTFAEIGAGQEVVRWFFHAGHASATVAKSISAYDTAVSDEIYGKAGHYVSRERLESMLDYEYNLLLRRVDATRGEKTSFFVFADTVATRTRTDSPGGHGWLGVRFQTAPRAEPSEIILHVQLLDHVTVAKQEALGMLGVNLIHAAFFLNESPHELIAALSEGLRRTQVEVDMIRLSGPAFHGVDNRLMSLQLVEQGLTDATMFTAEGEVVQPSEAISGKALLMERGAFRPVTNVTWEMLQGAQRQFRSTRPAAGATAVPAKAPVVLMEMTLSNLVTGHRIDHGDFLARASMLNALGITVMISNYDRFDLVTSYLRRYTKEPIVMVMGAPTLVGIFEEKYYSALPGGILEGLGRLFQGDTTLYVYPMKAGPDAPVVDAVSLPLAPLSRRLYWYLLESGQIQSVREFREEQLHVYPDDVLAKIQSGDMTWESMVPPQVAEIIRSRGLFGYKPPS